MQNKYTLKRGEAVKAIKEARKAYGLTIRELAELSFVGYHYLYMIENNGTIPSFDIIQRLFDGICQAEALNCG